MVYIDVSQSGQSAPEAAAALQDKGVLLSVVDAGRLRAVLHLDVRDEDVARTIGAFQALLG
jgi:threonine aldolase